MNWTYMAFAAVAAGPILIAMARSRMSEGIFDAEQMPELALWGYFLMLVGAWGALATLANPSDLFFLVIGVIPALMALVARLRGYRAKGGDKALPDWAAFGFSNWVVLLSIGLLKTFVVEPMQIPSSSMRPGLIVSDFIVINKFAYGIRVPFLNEVVIPTGKPDRGDVVVFRFPLDPKINYIKRLIGLPGDTVEYRNKQLSVNGIHYESTPIGEYKYGESAAGEFHVNRMQEKSPSKSYQTLNDPARPAYDLGSLEQIHMNPEFSRIGAREMQDKNCQMDETGFICKVPAGHYLMMGDNRDNSNDGRYWGFVPENHLAGRAFLIWMNPGEMGRIGTVIR